MSENKPKIYLSDIHLENYTDQYEGKQATVEDAVFMGGRETVSLNGTWKYAVDQYDTCLRQKWFRERYVDEQGFTLPVDYSFDTWPETKLPACWNVVRPEFIIYDGSMVFTKTFSFDRKDEEEVYLRIGAANYICRVFLNGEYVGMHRGGSTPAFFRVTEQIKEENRILIAADSTRRPEQVPTENTDWFNYGGVYRDIELIRVPKVHMKDFRIGLVPDGTYHKIQVQVKMSAPVEAAAEVCIEELGIKTVVPVTEGMGECILEFSGIGHGNGVGTKEQSVSEPDLELWSPEHPKLYDVTASCMGDTVSDRVGFREIKVEQGEILLNGKPVFLRGISCHEDSAVNGKALTDEERIENIKLAKELGCNFMRIAHYPHHENMAKFADELGILLWEEIPVYWAILFDRDKTYEDAKNQLRELITRDWNRASVIVWSVGNENADSDERLSFMSRLAQCARKEDSTRLISAACLVDGEKNQIADRLTDYLDVIGINEYYGWYSPDFEKLPQLFQNSNPDKPVIITEFGADALTGLHGTTEDKGTEEYQAYVYERQIETIRNISYIKGMTPWILYDFRCPRRTAAIQKYYNRKGLLSEDKSYKKPAFYVLQKFYEEKRGEQ
ncbi:MAG: glycoside hydrolase family 2 [Lachnospiraceae bacterium]|nr:glycoside hydrolase family 2 [Lachnospiraceae bacterium]